MRLQAQVQLGYDLALPSYGAQFTGIHSTTETTVEEPSIDLRLIELYDLEQPSRLPISRVLTFCDRTQ